MSKGKKHRFTKKQDRQAEHIAKSEITAGKSPEKAKRIGYATVNKNKKKHTHIKNVRLTKGERNLLNAADQSNLKDIGKSRRVARELRVLEKKKLLVKAGEGAAEEESITGKGEDEVMREREERRKIHKTGHVHQTKGLIYCDECNSLVYND